MEDKQKTSIANELFFIGKIYVIALVILIILSAILSKNSREFSDSLGPIFLIPFIFVGIGYAIRLIKWVFKWKS